MISRAESDLIHWDLTHNSGLKTWAGIDEVGRGCLAGPVVACCVVLNHEILHSNFDIFRQVRDSKKISPSKRERLASQLANILPAIGYGVVDCIGIDRDNILQSSLNAMRQAVEQIELPVSLFYIDGIFSPGLNQAEVLVVKGDNKSCAIAAASILAKVHRDNLMLDLAAQYPNYHFDKNKGYGTRDHLKSLDLYGACPIHRLTFEPVRTRLLEDLKIFHETRDKLCATQNEIDLTRWFQEVFKINYGKINMEHVEDLRHLYLQRLVSFQKGAN
ncbi:MAG: ribonuclease HII [Holophagaceae bacterium]